MSYIALKQVYSVITDCVTGSDMNWKEKAHYIGEAALKLLE